MESRMLKGDDGSALRFYWGTEKNPNQSLEKGRPVFDKILYLEVISPGQNASSPVHWLRREFDPELNLPVMENAGIVERYPAAYKAFMDGEETKDLTGTPIEQWPAIDVAMAETLRASRIYTVDALAVLPDEKLRLLGMGGRDLRARAQAYIDAASGNAAGEAAASQMSQMAEEIERLKNALAAVQTSDELKEQNAALQARVAELETAHTGAADTEDLIGSVPAPAEPPKPVAPAAKRGQTKV